MAGTAEALGIEHVFVLMLENRSFDHMLGFSAISGADAETGRPTQINGLAGNEFNVYGGQEYPVSRGADDRMPIDPGHEFPDVLRQLCGPAATYPAGGPYPPIDNSGFVASYLASPGAAPAEIMKCYQPQQLPVLNALAREFVVCDNWHASMPGPTWPNRMFVHAASSGGLDHSPTTAEIVTWETLDGFRFNNGTIFDVLQKQGIRRCLYGGDDFPMLAALKGIHLDDIRHYSLFAADVAQENYPDSYIFIEPSYDALHDYRAGSSQHPLADVTNGEALIKATYEALRNSPNWESSLIIVTWDEHGGFYDHAIPPGAPAPGDTQPNDKYNTSRFTFEQYGPRVPAIVISPRIPKNLVDHRLYDHSCIPKLLESLFGLNPLTARDANAALLDRLVTLGAARQDTPGTLPDPAGCAPLIAPLTAPAPNVAAIPVTRPGDSIDEGNLPSVVNSAMQQDLSVSPPSQKAAIVAQVASLKTRADAMNYMAAVQKKVLPHRNLGPRV